MQDNLPDYEGHNPSIKIDITPGEITNIQSQAIILTTNLSADADSPIIRSVAKVNGGAFYNPISEKASDGNLKHGDVIFVDGTYIPQEGRAFKHVIWIVNDARQKAPIGGLIAPALQQASDRNLTSVAIPPIGCSPKMAELRGITVEQAVLELVHSVQEAKLSRSIPEPLKVNFVANDPQLVETLKSSLSS